MLIAKITPSFENGKGAFALGLVNGIGFGTTELHVIRVGDSIDSKFLYYLTVSYSFRMFGASQMYGTAGQKRVPDSFINDFQSPIPPLPEQRAIAAFLAAQTAKIDSLLAKKERLIELLKEKRTALINHAVTKGLDPQAEMKESGGAWLGKIPNGWNVKSLKHISPRQLVGVVVNPSQYVVAEGVPFLFGGDVSEDHISIENARRISSESNQILYNSILHSGDLVTVRVGYPGITAVIPPELDGCNCASMMIIRQYATFDSHWLCYVMNSRVGRSQVEVVQYGAAQEQFNISHAVNFLFPVPSLLEQRAIATHLDRETAKIDALIAKVGEAMERLREYRSALIAAAVTGKVDVTSPLDSLSRK